MKDGEHVVYPGFEYVTRKPYLVFGDATLDIASIAPEHTGNYSVQVLVNDGNEDTLYEHNVSVSVGCK